MVDTRSTIDVRQNEALDRRKEMEIRHDKCSMLGAKWSGQYVTPTGTGCLISTLSSTRIVQDRTVFSDGRPGLNDDRSGVLDDRSSGLGDETGGLEDRRLARGSHLVGIIQAGF